MIKNYSFSTPSVYARPEGTSQKSNNILNDIQLQHPLGHKIEGHFESNKDEIIFISKIIEPVKKPTLPKQPHPEWYFHDHLVLFIDPKHDHMQQFMVAINKDGTVNTGNQVVLPGEEISDRIAKALKTDELKFSKEVKVDATGWSTIIKIPFISLGLSSKPDIFGAKVKFGFEDSILYDAVTWPQTSPEFGDFTLAFADVYTSDNIVIEHIDFGTPYWHTGDISNTITIKGKVNNKIKLLELQSTVINVLSEKEVSNYSCQISNNSSFEIKIPWNCHFANKWAPDFTKTARVNLIFSGDSKIIWNATYPFGFDAGIIVRDPYGKFKSKKYERPEASNPNFVDAFRCFLFSKLPDWVFQTTKDKAPSDFYLKDNNGKFHLNLMDDNSLEKIADYLKSEFNDWQDALCAASLILHHPFLTRHSGSWNVISGRATTATVLKLGGCFCGDTARVAAHLADIIGQKYKVPLKGFSLGLRGHLTGLVETPIGEILIDPMLGIYYHSLDNKRLATLQEMQEDKRIHSRMWLLAYSNGHEFFINTYNQIKTPHKKGDFNFPAY